MLPGLVNVYRTMENHRKSSFLMGKSTINGGKSSFLMGKSTINGHVQ